MIQLSLIWIALCMMPIVFIGLCSYGLYGEYFEYYHTDEYSNELTPQIVFQILVEIGILLRFLTS